MSLFLKSFLSNVFYIEHNVYVAKQIEDKDQRLRIKFL